MEGAWSKGTGSLTYGNHTWTGSGWTGQPLMMKWPKETKVHMNMYDWAKEKDDLVEVIYVCLDGKIYFLDLETGEATRDVLKIGYAFKGSGALDPRGYPIMYVGSGYDSSEGRSRVFIINLLDCSVMYTFGNGDSFSLRGNLSYFDSSALIDAETDTLIYPGENGILYLIKLNTAYDEAAHAWSSPVCVYNSDGTGAVLYCSSAGKMYLLNGKTGATYDTCVLSDGVIEASPAVYKNYVVIGTRACKIWGICLH